MKPEEGEMVTESRTNAALGVEVETLHARLQADLLIFATQFPDDKLGK